MTQDLDCWPLVVSIGLQMPPKLDDPLTASPPPTPSHSPLTTDSLFNMSESQILPVNSICPSQSLKQPFPVAFVYH